MDFERLIDMNFKAFLPHLTSLLVFIIAALLFHPITKGQKISQSDITQYIGMSKELRDFRANTNERSIGRSAFSGMPTYQLGAHFPNDYVQQLIGGFVFYRDNQIIFSLFSGILYCNACPKVDWKLSVLGALAFGFSTYLIIILEPELCKSACHRLYANGIGRYFMGISTKISVGVVVTALAWHWRS